jgi:hypothetical protein
MGHLIHIASIIGAVAAAHHFWPKGVTYGEREDWEKEYRRRRYSTTSARVTNAQGWYDDTATSSNSSSRESSKSGRARDTLDKKERERRRDSGRDRDRDSRYERESSARPVRERDIEYGTQPVYSRHARHHHHHHHREYDYEYEGGDEEPPAYSRRASARY